eukprot:CAMPEP_0170541684 /NCGR_PEP_ID=MMETSP0211-20121228/1352_1 /TAXON_ID=311385 /ORGANISM="Pseudokeronopsis sp., Strain OXSARD2" /LENGTH=66 /DNA_ID=CAMNT_0010844511 /DNA_START=1454 /DNA_END=1654 /DNA_ORIENTATION=+
MPSTAKAEHLRSNKIDLTLADTDEINVGEVGIIKTPKTASTSSNKKISKEYMKNRDPMKEFFQLTC